MKKVIVLLVVIVGVVLGVYIYSNNKKEDYPNIRNHLNDLFTENVNDVHIEDKDGKDITKEFVDEFNDEYASGDIDQIIDEISTNDYFVVVNKTDK